MIRFYGSDPPCEFDSVRVGGTCPSCGTDARFSLTSPPDLVAIGKDNARKFIAGYTCDACMAPIAICWEILGYGRANSPKVDFVEVVQRTREPFNFDHVPEAVQKEIEEALDCLSVDAYNGFAALCRRAVQALCTNLGAGARSKVRAQIKEMVGLTGLGEDWEEHATQVMLSGHDGSHPHLPEVDRKRAALLLSLLRDLVFQLYTRPGKVREAAALRREAIERRKE